MTEVWTKYLFLTCRMETIFPCNESSLSRDSLVGKAMVYGRGIKVRFPVQARDYSLLHGVQTDYGAHPVSYSEGTGVKQQRRESDRSPTGFRGLGLNSLSTGKTSMSLPNLINLSVHICRCALHNLWVSFKSLEPFVFDIIKRVFFYIRYKERVNIKVSLWLIN
jgi:hypothetical protein